MTTQAQFYIVHFGQKYNKNGKQEYVQLLAVGFDPDEAFDEAESFFVLASKRTNPSLPIMSFETFKKILDLYPAGLTQKIQEMLDICPKITNFNSVQQVKSWDLWTEQMVRESVLAYY